MISNLAEEFIDSIEKSPKIHQIFEFDSLRSFLFDCNSQGENMKEKTKNLEKEFEGIYMKNISKSNLSQKSISYLKNLYEKDQLINPFKNVPKVSKQYFKEYIDKMVEHWNNKFQVKEFCELFKFYLFRELFIKKALRLIEEKNLNTLDLLALNNILDKNSKDEKLLNSSLLFETNRICSKIKENKITIQELNSFVNFLSFLEFGELAGFQKQRIQFSEKTEQIKDGLQEKMKDPNFQNAIFELFTILGKLTGDIKFLLYPLTRLLPNEGFSSLLMNQFNLSEEFSKVKPNTDRLTIKNRSNFIDIFTLSINSSNKELGTVIIESNFLFFNINEDLYKLQIMKSKKENFSPQIVLDCKENINLEKLVKVGQKILMKMKDHNSDDEDGEEQDQERIWKVFDKEQLIKMEKFPLKEYKENLYKNANTELLDFNKPVPIYSENLKTIQVIDMTLKNKNPIPLYNISVKNENPIYFFIGLLKRYYRQYSILFE